MNKKGILQYGAAIVIAVAVFVTGAFSQDLFQETITAEIFGTLSDCFLFPAVLLGGVGALTWIASEGAFDMLSYGFHTVFRRLTHPTQQMEGFYEYKVRRQEEQKGWLKHWLIVGLVCMALSALCLVLYMSM